MDDGRVAQAPCDCIARHRWASRQPYSCALRISRTVAITLQPPRPEPGIRAFADQRGIEPGMYTRKYEVGPMVSVRRSRMPGEDLRKRRNGRPRARTIAAGPMKLGRAACRERVCQSVEISVAAVILKNKITTPEKAVM